MRFSVIWSEDAENMLAWIWLRAAHRRSVNVAQSQIDALLTSDTVSNGIVVSEDLYSITVAPLRAHYEIDAGQHEVRVTGVTWVR